MKSTTINMKTTLSGTEYINAMNAKYQAVMESMESGGHWSVREVCDHQHRTESAAYKCAERWERRSEREGRENIEAELTMRGNNRWHSREMV
jgi:hypothetical protein